MNFQEYPLYGAYDVIVVGGGTAGFAAGISAARNGARTLVIEKNPFLGGMSTGGLVSQFLGFPEHLDKPYGVMNEVIESLADRHATTGIYGIRLLDKYPIKTASYDAEILKNVLDKLVVEAGAEVLFHTTVIDVCKEKNEISKVVIHNTEGIQIVTGKIIIDTSFHGEVAARAGCRWEKGRPTDQVVQPGTLMFRLSGVDFRKFEAFDPIQKSEIMQQGIDRGILFRKELLCRPVPSQISADKGFFYFNNTRVSVDPLSAKSLSAGEIEGRRQVQEIIDFYRENLPGFENAILVSSGCYLGQRDSRRILGNHVLSIDDIMRGTKFDDAVAATSYPIDIHKPGEVGDIITKPASDTYYIPYRCMVNQEVANLIVAGRCISTSFEANAAIRVMAVCMQLGEAAGLAASLCIREGTSPNAFDGRSISNTLLKNL